MVTNLLTSSNVLRCLKLQMLLFLHSGGATPRTKKLHREWNYGAILGAKIVKGKSHIRGVVANVSAAALAARDQALVFQGVQPFAQSSKTHT
jgi:hypothetical protein